MKVDHKRHTDLVTVFCGDLSFGVLDGWYVGVSTDSVHSGHVAYCVERVGKGLLWGEDVISCCSGWCVRVFTGVIFVVWLWGGLPFRVD